MPKAMYGSHFSRRTLLKGAAAAGVIPVGVAVHH